MHDLIRQFSSKIDDNVYDRRFKFINSVSETDDNLHNL